MTLPQISRFINLCHQTLTPKSLTLSVYPSQMSFAKKVVHQFIIKIACLSTQSDIFLHFLFSVKFFSLRTTPPSPLPIGLHRFSSQFQNTAINPPLLSLHSLHPYRSTHLFNRSTIKLLLFFIVIDPRHVFSSAVE